ncbi:hypothetical protein COB55_03525 [Candidatus Wolfebacteria bacterium]|nr:MAG: hypothetical protein COB55_03525 [Candidatus Wolfebacteria bacterium]
MKLEIKHKSPYYPYKVKCILSVKDFIYEMETTDLLSVDGKLRKMILRPLIDITKEIEHNGEKFIPMELFRKYLRNDILNDISQGTILDQSYEIVQKLIELHFDVFGLIDQGLAIDINTLKNIITFLET